MSRSSSETPISRSPSPSPRRRISRSPSPSPRHHTPKSHHRSPKTKQTLNSSIYSDFISDLDFVDLILLFFLSLFVFLFFTVDGSVITLSDYAKNELQNVDYKTGLKLFYVLFVLTFLITLIIKKYFKLNIKPKLAYILFLIIFLIFFFDNV